MKMSPQDALTALRAAGYHKDRSRFMRLALEQNVAARAANDAWDDGERARACGVPCTCSDCTPTAPARTVDA